MKNLIPFITLLIFVNTITNYMIGTKAKEEELPVPVLDIDGDEIRAGTEYLIQPIFSGAGGGGLTAQKTEGLCAYGVVQYRSDLQSGEPVVFFPNGYKVGDVVHESTDLNIEFAVTFGCSRSSVWKVGDYDQSAKNNFIMLGGSVGNPGNETVANWFKIEKLATTVANRYYKIVYCPSVCDLCAVTCSDVGRYFNNWARRLALSENAFHVLFQKVRHEHKEY